MIDKAQSRLRAVTQHRDRLPTAAVGRMQVVGCWAPSLRWPLLLLPQLLPGARTHQQEERETNNDLK